MYIFKNIIVMIMVIILVWLKISIAKKTILETKFVYKLR